MIARRKIVLDWPEPPHVLYPEQRAALADDVGIDVCVAGVGGGKTSTGASKIIRWALGRPRRRDGTPACYFVVGRDYRLVREGQLAEVEAHLRRLSVPYEAIVARSVGGQAPMIELRNGVTILGFSGSDPDRMRGFAADGCWLDESEWQPARAFEVALQRQRSAAAVRLIVTSSPSSESGWLWQIVEGARPEWNELRAKVPIRIHRWGSRVAANKADVLDAIVAAAEAVSPGKSRQEIDGLFVGTREAPFMSPFGQCEVAFVDKVALDATAARAFVLGIDLGKSVDYTALVVLGMRGHVLAIDRFNASSLPSSVKRELFYVHAEGRVLELRQAWGIPLLKIDTAMMGAAFADGLRQKLGKLALVEGLRTDSSSRKAEAVEALGLALQRGQVVIPERWTGPDGLEHVVANVDHLRRELGELVVEERGGRRVFDHPPGGHDDLVVALALAWQGLMSHPPAPRRPMKLPPAVSPQRAIRRHY